MLNRIITSILLVGWVVVLHLLPVATSDDIQMIYDWYTAFSLPVWAILTVGVWHDLGREFWTKYIELDSPTSKSSLNIRWAVFGLWMTTIYSVIIYTFSQLHYIPLLAIIPILAYSLRDWLVMDWSESPYLKTSQFVIILMWGLVSYVTSLVLSSIWIVSSVFLTGYTGIDLFFY